MVQGIVIHLSMKLDKRLIPNCLSSFIFFIKDKAGQELDTMILLKISTFSNKTMVSYGLRVVYAG